MISNTSIKLTHFETFSQQLKIKSPPTTQQEREQQAQPGCFNKVKKTLKEIKEGIEEGVKNELTINDARNEVGELFHSFEEGEAQKIHRTNGLFHSFQEVHNRERLFPDDKTQVHSNLEAPACTQNNKKLNQIQKSMKQYCHFLFEERQVTNQYNFRGSYKKEKKSIHRHTAHFFKNLIGTFPNEDSRQKGKELVKTLAEAGSRIVNDYEMTSENQCLNTYFDSCEKFVNLLFQDIDESSFGDKKEEFLFIKTLILNFISSTGLLLVYQKRNTREKFCLWAKRSFFPIGYVLHELAGVALQLFVNPCIKGAMVAAGAWTLTLVTSFIVGAGVIGLIDLLLDTGLEVAQEYKEIKTQQHLKKIMSFMNDQEKTDKMNDFFSSEKEENLGEYSFVTQWCKKIVEITMESLKACNDYLQKKIKKFISFVTNTPSKMEKNESVVNTLMNKKYENKPNRPNWFCPFTTNKNSIEKYFKLIQGKDEKLFSQLFYDQHTLVNMFDTLSQEDKESLKTSLEQQYETLAEKLLEKTQTEGPVETPWDNDSERQIFKEYIQHRLEFFSQRLVANSREALHKLAHHSLAPVYGLFDFTSDTLGVTLTDVVQEHTHLESSLQPVAETLGTIGGALPVVGAGIYVHKKIQKKSSKLDKQGFHIPNVYTQVYLKANESEVREKMNDTLKKLEKDGESHFHSAEMTKLKLELNKKFIPPFTRAA